jgi:aminopeptidase N
VRMLQTLLGRKLFRAGMDLYFARHDGQAATVEDFVACFADAAAVDLSQFMLWYGQAGTPELAVTTRHNAHAQTLSLEIAQVLAPTPGQPVKAPMVVPLAIGLVDAEGSDMPLNLADGQVLSRGVLTLTKAAQTFVFTGLPRRPALSINRGFSAPVKIRADLTADELRFLAAYDNDPFNRWQAVQTLATALLIENVDAIRRGGDTREDPGLIAALSAILADARLEPAFIAQALMMPSEGDIAREIGRDVDPDAIYRARRVLRCAIGTGLAPALRAAITALEENGPYSPDAASAGRRALKNGCLDLLVAPGEPTAVALAAQHYAGAGNMTDRLAALSTLSLHDTPERANALADFFRRHRADPLVIDKWFALQAMIPEEKTLARVQELAAHPAFSLANPNRVRALIGSFAQANQTQFNRADGAGFAFVADTVLALDQRNPQVAARLMTAFRSWRALEPERRACAEAEIRRVAGASGLSSDLKDIVERSLAAE